MRISGGKARGIPLRINKKSPVRAAIETSRERLFSSIFQSVKDASVLDLFAGSGSYGLEALSRGANNTTLVEKNRMVLRDLKSNLAAVLKSANLDVGAGRLVNRDVLDFLREKSAEPYELIFIDPPYEEIPIVGPKVFDLLLGNGYIFSHSLVILETPGELEIDFTGWSLDRVVGKEKRGSPVHRIYSSPHPRPVQ